MTQEYTKICKCCNNSFVVDRNHRMVKYCSKDCKRQVFAERSASFRKARTSSDLKICSICKIEQSLSNFSSDSHTYCRPCAAQWMKNKRKERSKEKWKQDREIIAAAKGRSYISYLTTNLPAIRSRAKIKNIEFDITAKDLTDLAEQQQLKCALTREVLTFITGKGRVMTNASVDRIDSNKGYIKNNIQLVSLQANTLKNILSMDELFLLCERILRTKNESS